MSALLVADRGKPHQVDAMLALQAGMWMHGIDAEVTWGAPDGGHDLVVCWGNKLKYDGPILRLEAGYINGDSNDYVESRLRFISTSWNQLHGRADAGVIRPSDRWDALGIEIQPWRSVGEYMLVLDQHPGDSMSPPSGFWASMVNDLHSGAVLRVRSHPLVDTSCNRSSLLDDLELASCAITWSSTAAVEAVVNGVPTISFSSYCIARPVTSHAIDAPLFLGEREQWAYDLAYRQWTIDELRSGEAWEQICPADFAIS